MTSAALFAAFVAFTNARAQQNAPADSVDCTHHIAFPDTDGVTSMAFHPDSASAYVHLHETSINAWNVAAHHWPEILWAIAGALLLLTLIALARVMRRPQSKGSPYCRTCNYDLTTHVAIDGTTRWKHWTAAPGTKCPECGVDLAHRRPKTGRRAWRRMAPVAIALLILAAALVIAYSTGAHHYRSPNHYFNWRWEWLNTLAENPRFAWLKRWQGKSDRVMQIDLTSGKVIRQITSTPVASYLEMCISPDGESLFLGGIGAELISRYSTRTGRLAGRFAPPGYTGINVRQPSIVRFSSDGNRAYVAWLDTKEAICGVSEWNLQTNVGKTLLTTPAHIDQRSGRSRPHSRHFLSSEKVDPPTFISYPNFMEAYPTKTYKIRTHTVGSDEAREFQPKSLPDYSAEPVLTPDGKQMIVQEQYGRSVMFLDLESGEIAAQLESRFDPVGRGLAITRDGTLLAVDLHRGIRIRDLRASTWRAQRLKLPDGLYAPRLWFSNDNRWLAAVCQKNLAAAAGAQTQAMTQPGTRVAPGGFTHELVLWDLSKLQNE